jgi:hypothetical protein
MQLMPFDDPYSWLDTDYEWEVYFWDKSGDMEEIARKNPVKFVTEIRKFDNFIQTGIFRNLEPEYQEILRKYDTDRCKDHLKNNEDGRDICEILTVNTEVNVTYLSKLLQNLFKIYQDYWDFRYADFTEIAKYILDMDK